jgi:hypothetical protein
MAREVKKSEQTGRSQLKGRRATLDCSATEEEEEQQEGEKEEEEE